MSIAAPIPIVTRSLLIFPGAIGDLICLLPALRALARRHPDASLELMARDELARLAVARMGIAAAHSLDRREVAALFNDSDDLPISTREFFSSFDRIYSFFAADHPVFRRSLTRAARGVVSFHPFRPPSDGHVASAYLASIGEPDAPLNSRIDLLDSDRHAATRLLACHGLSRRNFILLFPGSGSPAKNWPADRFAKLAARLSSILPVAIVLGPAESGLESAFAGFPILSNLDLGTLAAIVSLSAMFIGNDSGVSHLAAATGARGIALFGPTDPSRWRPLGDVKAIARDSLDSLGVAEVAAVAIETLAARDCSPQPL